MELTDDAWFEIIIRCDCVSICRLSCANHRMRTLCADDAVWIAKLDQMHIDHDSTRSVKPFEFYRDCAAWQLRDPWRRVLTHFDSEEKLRYETGKTVTIALIGPAKAGKSTAAIQMISPGSVNRLYDPTVEDNYRIVMSPFPGARAVTVDLFDTSGDNAFAGLRPHYSQHSDAIVVMFDVTDGDSIAELEQHHLSVLKEHAPFYAGVKTPTTKPMPLILFGNKADKLREDVFPPPAYMTPLGDLVATDDEPSTFTRCQKLTEMAEFAHQHGAMYYEGSAYSTQQMTELLRLAVRAALTYPLYTNERRVKEQKSQCVVM